MATTIKEFGIKLKIDDAGLKTSVNKAKTNLGGLGGVTNTTKDSMGKLQSGLVGVGLKIGGVVAGAAILTRGFQALKNVVVDLVSETAAYESAMANVSTLVDTSVVNMGEMEQSILSMAGELGSAKELTEGLYQVISAGVSEPTKALNVLETSAKFAQGGLVEMSDATDVLTTVLNAYGLETSEANRVSGILFQTIKDGKTTGQQLASALGSVIPSAATLGIKFEEVSAALAVMTKGGINTNEAVTALNGVMMAILKPADEAKKLAVELGIEFSKAGIEGAGGLQKWLALVKEKLGDNETAMATLFPNVRALKAAFALTGAQAQEYSDEMVRMSDTTQIAKNTQEAFEKQQQSTEATVRMLKNEFTSAFQEVILPHLRDFSKWARDNKDNIVGTFKNIAGAVKIMLDALDLATKNFQLIAGAILWLDKKTQGAAKSIGLLKTKTQLTSEEMRDWAAFVKSEQNKALEEMNTQMTAFNTIAAAITGQMPAFTGQMVESEEKIRKKKEALEKAKKEAKEAAEKLKILREEVRELNTWLPPATDKTKGITLAMESLKDEGIVPVSDASEEMRLTYGLVTDRQKEAVESTKNLTEGFKENRGEGVDLIQVFSELLKMTNAAIGALEQMGIISGELAGQLKGLTSGINAVGGGIGAWEKAGGGLEGILGKISAGFTVLTGAISVFAGIANAISGPSGEIEAVRRAMTGMQMNTEGWTKKLEALAKEIGGAGSAGRAFNEMLAEMINDSSITVQNLDTYITKIRHVVSTYEQGFASLEETSRNYNDAFAAILPQVRALGQEGGAAFTGLILLAEEFGLSCQAINDYVENELQQGFEGYKKYMEGPFYSATIGVFEEMKRWEDLLADNTEMVNGIQGIEDALIHLSNAQRLTEQQYQSFEDAALAAWQELESQGWDTQDIIKLMAPQLERLAFLEQEFGYSIDDSTKKMIDQGIESGHISEDMRTDNEKIIDGFDRLIGRFDLMLEAMGVKLPGAIDNFGNKAVTTFNNVAHAIGKSTNNLEDFVDTIPDNIDLGFNGFGGGGGANFQHGVQDFIVPPGFPNDSFRIGLTSGERINVEPAGNNFNTNNNNLTMNVHMNVSGNANPRQLMDDFWYGFKNNVNSIQSKMRGVL